MFERLQAWLDAHEVVLWIAGGASVLMFVGSLVALPWLIASLPADFFTNGGAWAPGWARHHPLLRWTVRIAKSVLGVALIVVGVAMLALPGQGVLTISVGVMLLEFPGKRRMVRWLGARRSVQRPLNWMRRRMHRPEFVHDHERSAH